MIFRLNERLVFPNPALADDDGLLPVRGDLSPGRLMLAYQNGIFPWYSEGEPILWYSPHERFVLFPQKLKISRSMRQVMQSNCFTVTVDTCFNEVVEACSSVPRGGQDGTWITADMKAAYTRLHLQGHAHSFEVWHNNQLAGGLYGIQTGYIFCGESMFSKVSNASKTALIWLCNTGQYQLIDCQVHTTHLESMGAKMISRAQYMAILRKPALKP